MAPHSRQADLAGRKKAGIYSQSIRSEGASLSLALEELSDSLSLIQRKEERKQLPLANEGAVRDLRHHADRWCHRPRIDHGPDSRDRSFARRHRDRLAATRLRSACAARVGT